MPTTHEESDPVLDRVEREIRRDIRVDAARVARIKAGIRRQHGPGAASYRSPRFILVAAAMLVLAFLLGRYSVRTPEPVPSAHTAWTGTATHAVRFVLDARNARRVSVVGIFNDWDPDATPLARGDDGRWTVDVPLPPGRHEYAFLVDGQRWVPDADAPRAPGDDFGMQNSVILVQATQ